MKRTMKNDKELIAAIPEVSSLRTVIRSEWQWWMPGAVLCFLLASVLMSGWPAGLVPNLASPFIYVGDGLSHTWLAQRAVEGWIFDNPRNGYPFGSNFLDYPGADSGNLLLLKVFGILTNSPFAAVNLYFLTSFAATFVSAYCVMRALGIGRALSMAGAVVFDFIPFHFQRISHLFYTWYFMAPLFFYIGLRIANSPLAFSARDSARRVPHWLVALGLMALGCFGVYYALFGLIILAVVFLTGLLGPFNPQAMRHAIAAICLVLGGVLLNIIPNIVYKHQNGPNLEVAQRSSVEAEVYAFKMVQLLLPRPDHRSSKIAAAAKGYNAAFTPLNENYISSLGMLGALGFLCMFLVQAAVFAGRGIDRNLRLVVLITLILFMFGTLGGFGVLFSQFISASIRAWNRISIFIGFGALLGLFMLLQLLCSRYLPGRRRAVVGLAGVIMIFGLLDQTVPACKDCQAEMNRVFELDRDFVAAIEKSVPPHSAIYQLPYMAFPETVRLFRLDTYDHAAGFLHSRTLKWSYAGMKGREGDSFYRALSRESYEKQINVVRRLGFAGVYIDRRGYEDNGQEIVARFTELLGRGPSLQRADTEIVFFPIGQQPGAVQSRPEGLSPAEIMEKAGYLADRLGRRYEATLAQGIDFTRSEFPLFVKDIVGLSRQEAWGRWTDANLAPSLRLDFAQPLPARGTLVLTMIPFGPNADKDAIMRVGSKTYRIRLKPGQAQYRQVLDLGSERATSIELVPPQPTAPYELGGERDGRKRGIGMVGLSIE